MTKHIGIVACSAEGAALCYRTICKEGPAILGRHSHPEITMHTHPLSHYMEFIRVGDWKGVATLMLSSVEKLERAGAEFCICPDNTIHQAFDLVIAESRLPWLHIAEVVAEEAVKKGFRHIGILGTKYLMTGPVYPEAFKKKNLAFTIPSSDERESIDRIIFDELVNAIFNDDSKAYFNRIIGGLRDQGCDAVVLGCTEIPLIVIPEESPLPTLDSTRLLARAALTRSVA